MTLYTHVLSLSCHGKSYLLTTENRPHRHKREDSWMANVMKLRIRTPTGLFLYSHAVHFPNLHMMISSGAFHLSHLYSANLANIFSAE